MGVSAREESQPYSPCKSLSACRNACSAPGSGRVSSSISHRYAYPACAAAAAHAVEEWAGSGHVSPCEPWSATESMAAYLERYPGVLAFLGIRNPEAGTGAGHHTTRFDVDDAWQYLKEE